MNNTKAEVSDLPPPNPNRNYRAAVVAQYTGIPTRSIYHGCATGRIRHARVGRSVTIPGTEIVRLNGAR